MLRGASGVTRLDGMDGMGSEEVYEGSEIPQRSRDVNCGIGEEDIQ